MLLLTDLLKCCCALCETSLFPHHCICKVLNIVPKLSPLFSVSHKCLAEVSLSNVIFSLFSRLPEAPQAVIKQRQEVPRPQARVRAPRAHPPAQGGAPSPCALQAPQLGQPPHPATIRNQHTWTNYGKPSHIQGLNKSPPSHVPVPILLICCAGSYIQIIHKSWLCEGWARYDKRSCKFIIFLNLF